MKDRLWGHDAITITVPYAIAKVISDRCHPHRDEALDAITDRLAEMLASSNPLEPGPIATILEGVLLDGADMSMGPVAYIHKSFLEDIEAMFEMLRRKIENGER